MGPCDSVGLPQLGVWSVADTALPAVIVTTRPDERGEQVGTLHSGSSKGSKKPVLQETRCNSGQFYAVLSEEFCALKILSLKFMQMIGKLLSSFCIFFH